MSKQYCMACGHGNPLQEKGCQKCGNVFGVKITTVGKTTPVVQKINEVDQIELGGVKLSKSSIQTKLASLPPIEGDELNDTNDSLVQLKDLIKI